MKRTSFLLATLTAIALLSCSQFDSPNSHAENTDYQPPKALQKASTGATISGSGSVAWSSCTPSSISGSSNGSSTKIGSVTCTYPPVPHSNATATSAEICANSVTGSGTTTVSVSCNSGGSGSSTFSGTCASIPIYGPVPTTCTFSFYLTCSGCSRTFSGWKSWVYYQF